MPNNRITPCKCGFLEREANQPDSPIRFDAKLNEYHFVHRMSTGGEAKMMIYTKLSETADVYVATFPTGLVGFSYLGKAVKKNVGQQQIPGTDSR
jgi:hypothetical protein